MGEHRRHRPFEALGVAEAAFAVELFGRIGKAHAVADADGVELMGKRTIPEIVSEYTAAGAPCISVVTGRWFGGNDEMLSANR